MASVKVFECIIEQNILNVLHEFAQYRKKNHAELILDCSHSLVWLVSDYTFSNPMVFISNFVNLFLGAKGLST